MLSTDFTIEDIYSGILEFKSQGINIEDSHINQACMDIDSLVLALRKLERYSYELQSSPPVLGPRLLAQCYNECVVFSQNYGYRALQSLGICAQDCVDSKKEARNRFIYGMSFEIRKVLHFIKGEFLAMEHYSTEQN